jgi:hypothetical protein
MWFWQFGDDEFGVEVAPRVWRGKEMVLGEEKW